MTDADNVLIGAGVLYIDGRDVGYTRDGVTFAFEREVYEVEADQAMSPIKTIRTRERLTIATVLLEATLENLRDVWDVLGSIEITATQKELRFGGGGAQLTEHELIFTGEAPGGFDRNVTIYKAISMEPGEHAYLKNEETRIPCTFLALEDDTYPSGERLGTIVDDLV